MRRKFPCMKPWTREHTRLWINQLENRIHDIEFYLDITTRWCEDHFIHDETRVSACYVITIIWVCAMRSESVSRQEVMEIMGVELWENFEDHEFLLGEEYLDKELEELLEHVVEKFQDDY